MILPDWSNYDRAVTIRSARPGDRPALLRLAALDSQQLPAGPMLIGEVAGEPWAAVSLDGGTALADPFHPSAEVAALLRSRARQLRAAA
jgi:hypothetical protein